MNTTHQTEAERIGEEALARYRRSKRKSKPKSKPSPEKTVIVGLLCMGAVLFLLYRFMVMGNDPASDFTTFHPWHGYHYKLVAHVKGELKNPKSFEHVKTKAGPIRADTYTVFMNFRATNGYGGVVPLNVTAEISESTGEVVSCEWGDGLLPGYLFSN